MQQQWQLQGRLNSDSEDDDSRPELPEQHLPDVSYAGLSAQYRHARDFGAMFREDGRMGVPGTLHRISVLRNAAGTPIGLTYRLGRHVPDTALLLADILSLMKASIMAASPMDRCVFALKAGSKCFPLSHC